MNILLEWMVFPWRLVQETMHVANLTIDTREFFSRKEDWIVGIGVGVLHVFQGKYNRFWSFQPAVFGKNR